MITRETLTGVLERPKEEGRKKHSFQTQHLSDFRSDFCKSRTKARIQGEPSLGSHFQGFVECAFPECVSLRPSGSRLERKAGQVFIQASPTGKVTLLTKHLLFI